MQETIANIPRPRYLSRILPYIDKDLIKVLIGQRRVGKSYILRSVRDEIRKNNPEANFVIIDLEDFAFSHVRDAAGLNEEIRSRLSSERKNYIFIDEIQEVEEFERVLRSLRRDPNNDIYVTGSNSAMLSAEIGSRLAGRSVAINIHPLAYSEFLDFHSLEDSDTSIDQFLRFGGMPYLRNLPSTETWSEYLSGLSDAIVYRDILTRHKIRNIDFLERLLLFLGVNIGQLFTAKRIADYLKSQRVTTSVTAIQTYVDHIVEAFMINRVRRWDIRGKKYFEIGEKYYYEDLGIRNSIIGYRPMDIGGLLENAVYNHLRIEGYDVKIGSLNQGREIDFIAEKNHERRYIQVALNVNDPTTAEREFGNLASIPDNYEKTVVTLRDSMPNTFDGIRLISLRDFLTT